MSLQVIVGFYNNLHAFVQTCNYTQVTNYMDVTIPLHGQNKGKSRDTTEMYPGKLCKKLVDINLWYKCIAFSTHNITSQLFIRFYIQSVTLIVFSTPCLAICFYKPSNNCDNQLWHSTYWYCYQHNSCNMYICDQLDMCA